MLVHWVNIRALSNRGKSTNKVFMCEERGDNSATGILRSITLIGPMIICGKFVKKLFFRKENER